MSDVSFRNTFSKFLEEFPFLAPYFKIVSVATGNGWSAGYNVLYVLSDLGDKKIRNFALPSLVEKQSFRFRLYAPPFMDYDRDTKKLLFKELIVRALTNRMGFIVFFKGMHQAQSPVSKLCLDLACKILQDAELPQEISEELLIKCNLKP